MLYLAEVQRKTGFIGSGKADFKLLACQRGDTWTGVPGDEVIAAPDDAGYNAGALVMVELTNNRQIKRHYDAGRPLVGILQNFSNQSKKSKSQEEEIEQWKQSLTFQSQELNRRELELETRQEQVEEAEADLEKLEAQRQEIETAQQELDGLKEELDRKHGELQGAWDHLNGEIRRFEERQEDASQNAGLDEAQSRQLQDALERLTNAVTPTEGMREQLNLAYDLVNQQQELLSERQQSLEEQQQQLEDHRNQLQQEVETLAGHWQGWHEAETGLNARRADLKVQQQVLVGKQSNVQALSQQLQAQSNLYQRVYELLNTSDKVRLSDKVDVAALDALPIDELEKVVTDLEKDLGKVSRFVNDQEEELKLEQQAIDELKQRMEQVSEFDRLQLETELAEEQDRYQMLNETLVGQRRNLLEREEVLSQHQAVLRRRQGLATEETPVSVVDLEPVLKQIDIQRQQTSDKLQQGEIEIKEMQAQLEAMKKEVEQKSNELAAGREDLKNQDLQLRDKQVEIGAMEGRLHLLAELLSPLQEKNDGMRQTLDDTSESLSKVQEASDYQLQAIAEVKQLVSTLAANDASEAVSA
ncbi:MAG: pilus motility taxis protein HmpF [Cyanobacteria bacterium P01_F01_bin.56]